MPVVFCFFWQGYSISTLWSLMLDRTSGSTVVLVSGHEGLMEALSSHCSHTTGKHLWPTEPMTKDSGQDRIQSRSDQIKCEPEQVWSHVQLSRWVCDSGERFLTFELSGQSNYTPPFLAPEATCWLAGTAVELNLSHLVSHSQSQDCVRTPEFLRACTQNGHLQGREAKCTDFDKKYMNVCMMIYE